MLCLDKDYKKTTRKCGKLDTDGYAHHAYTTAKGPRFVPPNSDDVTLGVLSRLERALDLAAKAKRLPAPAADLPDRVRDPVAAGPHPGRQPSQAGRLHGARRAHGVRQPARGSFSQYLMSDDRAARSELNRYAGFESGLRTSQGQKKPAYRAFRLPLAVENYGGSDVLWGLVRQKRREPG